MVHLKRCWAPQSGNTLIVKKSEPERLIRFVFSCLSPILKPAEELSPAGWIHTTSHSRLPCAFKRCWIITCPSLQVYRITIMRSFGRQITSRIRPCSIAANCNGTAVYRSLPLICAWCCQINRIWGRGTTVYHDTAWCVIGFLDCTWILAIADSTYTKAEPVPLVSPPFTDVCSFFPTYNTSARLFVLLWQN